MKLSAATVLALLAVSSAAAAASPDNQGKQRKLAKSPKSSKKKSDSLDVGDIDSDQDFEDAINDRLDDLYNFVAGTSIGQSGALSGNIEESSFDEEGSAFFNCVFERSSGVGSTSKSSKGSKKKSDDLDSCEDVEEFFRVELKRLADAVTDDYDGECGASYETGFSYDAESSDAWTGGHFEAGCD